MSKEEGESEEWGVNRIPMKKNGEKVQKEWQRGEVNESELIQS